MKSSKPSRARRAEIDLQRAYYANTAREYDRMHLEADGEHGFALNFMISVLDRFQVRSILDVGSGTGRALIEIKKRAPAVSITGVESSAELRSAGFAKGLSCDELVDGDATSLAYADGAFDLVCEFGALHHIPEPSKAVAEMLRVARRAIFISDSNNFGQGGSLSRFAKQSLRAAGLWSLANLVKTKGKGYSISEGDGLFYSYSVFDDLKQISRQCEPVHMLNTLGGGPDLYRTAPQVALLAIKRRAG